MRTTLTIDDQVLAELKRLAARQRRSLSDVVSGLLAQALQPKFVGVDDTGLPVMPIQPEAGRATLQIVNELRDELP